jgi:hypothetical protein
VKIRAVVLSNFLKRNLLIAMVLLAAMLAWAPRVHAQASIGGQGVTSPVSVSGGSGCSTSGTSILKGNGSGGCSNASSGTDYAPATSGSSILLGNGSGGFSNVTIGSNLTFSGGTLSASGGGASAFGQAVWAMNAMANAGGL